MALFFLTLLAVVIVINVLFFLSRTLSPIPYFPTNNKDLQLIIKTLLTPNYHAVIDLGAGTGTVIFPTALETYKQNSKTQYYAVEIHPLLIVIMQVKRFFHPNRKNIYIVRTDLFNLNFSNLTIKQFNNITIYLYVGPFVMSRLKPVLRSFPKNTRIVSYMYEIPGWEKYLTEIRTGEKKLYCYELKKQ